MEFEEEEYKESPKERHLREIKSRRTKEERLLILHKAIDLLKEEPYYYEPRR